MPKPFDELKKKDISLPRNPILAKLYRMVKLAENAGFGLEKMERKWKGYSQTMPLFSIEFDSVILQFPMKLGDRLGDRLSNNQMIILQEIEKNESVSISELSTIIGIATTAIENNISKLKDLGLLERVGPAKGGVWKIVFE